MSFFFNELNDVESIQNSIEGILNNVIIDSIDILFNFEDVACLAKQLVFFSTIRPFDIEKIIKICEMYINSSEKVNFFKFSVLRFSYLTVPIIAHSLYQKGLIFDDEITWYLNREKRAFPFLYFTSFITMFKCKIIEAEDYSLFANLIQNDDASIRKIVEIGWKEGTIGYFIKLDHPEDTRCCINLYSPIEWSPFEWCEKPKSLLPISVSIQFRSLKFFAFLMPQYDYLPINIVHCIIAGGFHDLISFKNPIPSRYYDSIVLYRLKKYYEMIVNMDAEKLFESNNITYIHKVLSMDVAWEKSISLKGAIHYDNHQLYEVLLHKGANVNSIDLLMISIMILMGKLWQFSSSSCRFLWKLRFYS